MEQQDRDNILKNIDKLMQFTSYDKLMKECIENKLLFDVMQEQIEVNISQVDNCFIFISKFH